MKKIKLLAVLLCLLFATAIVAKRYSELSGQVKWKDGQPAKGTVLSIGGYSVRTDKNGGYKFKILKPGEYVVSISPPGKRTKSFKVNVTDKHTKKDFIINW